MKEKKLKQPRLELTKGVVRLVKPIENSKGVSAEGGHGYRDCPVKSLIS